MSQIFSLFLLVGACLFGIDSLKDQLTIITTTSIIPAHPNTAMLEETQGSLFAVAGFMDCPKIIVFDGLPGCKKGRKEAYQEYKRRVEALTKWNPHFANTQLVFCEEHHHLAGALKQAMQHVRTPLVFVHQHDFKMVKLIDAYGIVHSMLANPNLKHIRLNRRGINKNDYDYIVDNEIDGPVYVPLTRTFGWSDNDHFSWKEYYDDFIFPNIKRKLPMEKVIQPMMRKAILKSLDNHKEYGTYIYGKIGSARHILHIDGKRWAKHNPGCK